MFQPPYTPSSSRPRAWPLRVVLFSHHLRRRMKMAPGRGRMPLKMRSDSEFIVATGTQQSSSGLAESRICA
eukprot:scaffold15422_cov107-Isochrysis_galbana.AAC.6